MSLEKYQQKRNFDKTEEPKGQVLPSSERLLYSLQKHDARSMHYDLRLEWKGVLLSWAVPKGPSMNPADKRLAVQVEDHPVDYRTFEGTIPKGEYGGGTVQLFDEGLWYPLMAVDEALKKGELKFLLAGKRLKGQFVLVLLKDKEKEEQKNWLLIKEKDSFALEVSGLDEHQTSISSGKTLEEIGKSKTSKATKDVDPVETKSATGDGRRAAKEIKPESVQLPFTEASVMLATRHEHPPTSDGWMHEIKYDGYRVLAFCELGKSRLITRNGLDWTNRFGSVSEAFKRWELAEPLVLDGELVVFDPKGRSSFGELQRALKKDEPGNLHYVVFDLLAKGDEDTRALPFSQRRKILERLMLLPHPPQIMLSPMVDQDGEVLYQAICSQQLEGIVSKRLSSKYQPGRSSEWIKVKCRNRDDFVIVGYTISEKSVTGFSSLLLGYMDEAGIRYAGRAGTGFTLDETIELLKTLTPLRQSEPTVSLPKEYRPKEQIVWLKPELLAEVQFAERTSDGVLRQPSFIGLREDMKLADIIEAKESETVDKLENPKPPLSSSKKTGKSKHIYAGIEISSPDKIIDTEHNFTKADVAAYYDTMRNEVLRFLANRPVSLVRNPDGLAGEGFYMKHFSDQMPGVQPISIKENDGDEVTYMSIVDAKGLLGAVQMSTIEFHPWGSHTDTLEKPDMLVFDLDPDEGLALDALRGGVEDIYKVLNDLNLEAFLKTSGGKGYHVVVPLIPNASWDKAREFSKQVAEVLAKKWPKKYTANMSKAKRGGKIYIDWVRNGRGATSVAPFSLRARSGLPISWPISLDALGQISPNHVTLENFQKYLGEDPWAGYEDVKQSLRD